MDLILKLRKVWESENWRINKQKSQRYMYVAYLDVFDVKIEVYAFSLSSRVTARVSQNANGIQSSPACLGRGGGLYLESNGKGLVTA